MLMKYHFGNAYVPDSGFRLDREFDYYGMCKSSNLVRNLKPKKLVLEQRGHSANIIKVAEIEVGSSLAVGEVHNCKFFNTIFVVTPLAIFTETIINELKISGYQNIEKLKKPWTKILLIDHYGKLSDSVSYLPVTIKYL